MAVMPEIEVPGHSSAALAAYPQFGNTDSPGYNPQVQAFWSIFPETLAPKPETLRFLDDIFDEVLAIFPSTFIHVGGDEAPKVHWETSPSTLAFMKANAGLGEDVARVNSHPLRPTRLKDIEDNLFLQHDLNVLNFIIELNAALRAQGKEIMPAERLDFSMISDRLPEFEVFPTGPLNRIDVQTAVEFYTPMYALMLPRNDFVRAAHSLQLDETVAIYIARILGTDYHLNFIKNGHPMVALSTLQAGYRLMMHGLDCEALHGWLRQLKARQAAGLPIDPRAA